MSELSDAELLCGFMEPKPEALYATGSQVHPSIGGWWQSDFRYTSQFAGEYYWKPVALTLDRLREIEARLTDEQWTHYLRWLMYDNDTPNWSRTVSYGSVKTAVHASPDQKIRALAAVFRGGPNA